MTEPRTRTGPQAASIVEGAYEVSLPGDASKPVAVRISDMPGEEVLVVLDR